MRLASESSWRHDGKGAKESKRILLDDSIKILCYGDCRQEGVIVPHFASFRQNEEAILWPFGIDSAMDIVKSGLVETMDINFEHKKPMAIMTGGRLSGQPTAL